MSERVDHAAEARRVLEAGRESAAKAKTAAQAGRSAEADAHGRKAHGCWMQAQAEATLALVEQQRIANRIALGQFRISPNEVPVFRHLVLQPHGELGVAPVAEIAEALGL